MNWKKLVSVLTLGLAVFVLVACGQKTTEEVIQSELKDSYSGSSDSDSGLGLMFVAGEDTLTFDKDENSITNSQGYTRYFTVMDEADVPSDYQEVIDNELATALEGTDNFTVYIGREENPTADDADALYQIALSDGGDTIQIYELLRDSRDDGYYAFTGTANN